MIEVYVDGASKGNPGPSGAGIYIKSKENSFEYAIPLGNLSNHEAEFIAVIKAIDICIEYFPNEILSFRSDSKVVVDAIDKEYSKNPLYKPLLDEIMLKVEVFPLYFIKWIPSNQNKHADRLARQAIHTKQK